MKKTITKLTVIYAALLLLMLAGCGQKRVTRDISPEPAPVQESSPSTVTITSPTSGAIIRDEGITVRGTCSDNDTSVYVSSAVSTTTIVRCVENQFSHYISFANFENATIQISANTMTDSGTWGLSSSVTVYTTTVSASVPTSTPAPTNIPAPIDISVPTPTPTQAPAPIATNTPVPTATNTPAPTNTPVPAPTNTPTAATFNLQVANLNIEDTSQTEVASNVFRLKQSGTLSYGCNYNPGGTNNTTNGTGTSQPDSITDSTNRHAMGFSYPYQIRIESAVLRLSRSGDPITSMIARVHQSYSGSPSTTVSASSATVDVSTVTTAAAGANITFSYATPPIVSEDKEWSIVLEPTNTNTLDESNNFGWVSTSGNACFNFFTYKFSSNSGTSWGNSFNGGVKRSYFTLNVSSYITSGSAFWIVDGGAVSTWNLASLTLPENQTSGSAGFVSYDVGAGASTEPNYSLTNKNKAQIQAAGTLSGRYLYIRVNLSVPAPGYYRSEIGNGSISKL